MLNTEEVLKFTTSFSQAVSTKLKSKKMSIRQLARAANLTPTTVRNVLKGKPLSLDSALKVDRTLSLRYFKQIK